MDTYIVTLRIPSKSQELDMELSSDVPVALLLPVITDALSRTAGIRGFTGREKLTKLPENIRLQDQETLGEAAAYDGSILVLD